MSEEAQQRLETQPEELVVPLAAIRPDPFQPRRFLPPDLAETLAQGHETPLDIISALLEDGETRLGSETLTELRRLAASIERHGLINPISVRPPRPDESVPQGVRYLIVTGERRYWAHALLAHEQRRIQEGEHHRSAQVIRVTLTPAGASVRAHQLIENLMREDINAVEKAAGLWALRLELSGVNHGSFTTGSEPPVETDGALLPWSVVEQAVGLSNRYRIYLTGVLGLAPEAQALIQHHNLSERMIRPIVQKLRDRPDLQLQALEQLVAWQEAESEEPGPSRVQSVQALVEALLAAPSASANSREGPARAAPQVRRRVRGVLRFLEGLEATDRRHLSEEVARGTPLAADLRQLRDELNALLGPSADSKEPARR
jgi:hypothetical protein